MEIRPKKSRKAKVEPKRNGRMDWEVVERVLASPSVGCLFLWGGWGIGKTYCAYCKGRVANGVYALTLTPETPASELRGTYLPAADGSLTWHDGNAVRAMREGARLVINELAAASDDCLSFLYPVLEEPETARIVLPTNETVTPAPGFHVVITSNSPPDDLPPALRDRFDVAIRIEEPHPEALARLSEPLRTVARRGFALADERRVSLRGWLVLDRLRHEFDLELASMLVFGEERGAQLYDAIVLGGGC